MKKILIPALLMTLIACNQDNQEKASQTLPIKDSITSRPGRVYDTITKLSDLKNDTVIFKAPNGVCYLQWKENFAEDSIVPLSEEDAANNKSFVANAGGKCDGETFDGSDRKASKISYSRGEVSHYDNLAQLLSSLEGDDEIGAKIDDISATSKRVKDENVNVTVKTAWLYTFCRQTDEDYHLILGTTKNINTAKFFNAEISGLPAKNATDYPNVKNARDQFYEFFGFNKDECDGTSYTKAYMNNPIEISISGSLFFDKLHYQGHGDIGPSWARGHSYWEIHPIKSIDFKKRIQ